MSQLTELEKEQVVAICDHLGYSGDIDLKKLKFSPYLPYVFSEHGAVMLASILNSDRAIHVNIQIVRIYNKMREILITHKDLLFEIKRIKNQLADHEDKILRVFEYLKQLNRSKQKELEQYRSLIGFKSPKQER